VYAGWPTRLCIKTDLVVDSRLDSASGVQLTAEELMVCNTLSSKYTIKIIKKANMRNSCVKQKWQLITESLVRHRVLGWSGSNALFSVLTDCCFLYVLVHFGDEKQAYLSQREMESGRMIIDGLVCLHNMIIPKRRNVLTRSERIVTKWIFVISDKTLSLVPSLDAPVHACHVPRGTQIFWSSYHLNPVQICTQATNQTQRGSFLQLSACQKLKKNSR
jgi:hypothetical protein